MARVRFIAIALSIPALALGARAQTPLLQFPGTGVGARVASAGDIDADGTPDLLISRETRVRVASGRDGSTLFDIEAPNASFAGAGDVNLDGHADVIVGIRDAGVARVISGATATVLFELAGDHPSDLFGLAVAGPGDVNGDGVPDLVVGAGISVRPPGSALEYVRVFSGASGTPLYTLPGFPVQTGFGYAVCGAGDVTLDGLADIAVGARYKNQLQGWVGAYSGGDGSPVFAAPGTSTLTPYFGASIACVGDVGGDGRPDLIVGAPGTSISLGVPQGGILWILSGVDGGTLSVIVGEHYGVDPALNDGLGASVSSARDLDLDGVPDFLAGAPGYVNPAAPPFRIGYARVFSGATFAPLVTIFGPPGNSGVGSSVASVGDLNGDGASDALIGSQAVGATAFSLAGP